MKFAGVHSNNALTGNWQNGMSRDIEPPDWAPTLPAPLPGFSWHRFEPARVMAYRPDGWHVQEVCEPDLFTGFITEESIKDKLKPDDKLVSRSWRPGPFEMGLTVQLHRRVHELVHPLQPIRRTNKGNEAPGKPGEDCEDCQPEQHER
jgi:hypothetical protein